MVFNVKCFLSIFHAKIADLKVQRRFLADNELVKTVRPKRMKNISATFVKNHQTEDARKRKRQPEVGIESK